MRRPKEYARQEDVTGSWLGSLFGRDRKEIETRPVLDATSQDRASFVDWQDDLRILARVQGAQPGPWTSVPREDEMVARPRRAYVEQADRLVAGLTGRLLSERARWRGDIEVHTGRLRAVRPRPEPDPAPSQGRAPVEIAIDLDDWAKQARPRSVLELREDDDRPLEALSLVVSHDVDGVVAASRTPLLPAL